MTVGHHYLAVISLNKKMHAVHQILFLPLTQSCWR